MTVHLNSLKEVANKQVYMAIVLYISHQTWGDMITEVSTVEKSSEDAETWVSRQLEAKAVVWHQIIPYHLQASVSEITRKLVGALEVERRHMQDEMAKQLTEIADRISNLKAITYHPEEPPHDKKAYVLKVLEELGKLVTLAEHAPYRYIDEEGELLTCSTVEGLDEVIWQCDYERIQITLADQNQITLYIVWDNDAPECIADYSWSVHNDQLKNYVDLAIRKANEAFDYV